MEKPRITIEVEEDFKNEVKSKAAKRGKSIKEVVITLLSKWLKG